MFERDEIEMHHYSLVRVSMRSKVLPKGTLQVLFATVRIASAVVDAREVRARAKNDSVVTAGDEKSVWCSSITYQTKPT
jgi:hypothetical protein